MRTLAYGDEPEQSGDLHLPAGAGPHPVVVLWHGGGFEAQYDRTMLTAAAQDLAARGVAAWNVTYRRLGSGGGWPQTFDDARAALSHVARLDAPLALDDVTVLGFSAGHLLAHHAARSDGPVRPRRLVDLAGVSRLEAAVRLSRGSGTGRLLGDPDVEREAYAGADPSRRLPLGIPSLHVHGDADAIVPLAATEQHVRRSLEAGDDARLVVVPGAGHFELATPGLPGWDAVTAWL